MKNLDNTIESLNRTINFQKEVIKIDDETIKMLQEMVAVQKEMLATSKNIRNLDDKLVAAYKSLNEAYIKKISNAFFKGTSVGAVLTVLMALLINLIISLVS